MLKTSFITVALFTFLSAAAQVNNPVKWIFTAKKINSTTYEIHMAAAIGTGWHTYSQNTPDGGPVPTAIVFNKNPLLTMDGTTKEKGKLEKRHEAIFGVDVWQYSGKVDFVQTIKIKGTVKTSVTGSIEYMVCNDKECLPPKKDSFSIPLK